MRRSYRVLLVVLVVLVVLAVGLWVATRVYLGSNKLRQDVAARLEAIYGGPVQVDAADIGVLGDSSLTGLRLYEAGQPAEAPWATVGTVKTDVSALDLLRGVMPQQITLQDPAVTLHFDRDGHLMTRLPETKSTGGALPEIHITGGQVTLRQDERPEMVIKGVRADVKPDGDRLALSGAVADDYWGEWSLDGSADRDAGAVTATLKTDHADVTQEKLLRLPVVPAAVWKEVEAAGKTPVEFTFRHDPREKVVNHYRVALRPDGASVTLPTLSLHGEDVRGGVTVEDELVTLDKVSGRTLGGELRTDATLDFRGQEDRFHFVVTATGLETGQVPKTWGLPELLRDHPGKLSGHADLTVTYRDGEAHTSGTGDGKVTGVVLGGQPTTIELKLRPTRKGFGLGQEVGSLSPFSRERPASAAAALAGRSRLNGAQLATLILLQAPADPAAPPTYLEVTLNLKDVDLAKLVRDTGLKLPFEVGGRLTMKVSASLPVNKARDLRAYRASGTATLPTFSISGVNMKDVTAGVRYEDGVLTLDELRGQLVSNSPSGAKPYAGLFDGKARLGLVPEGDLSADLKLTEIPLAEVLRVAGVKEGAGGAVSGSAELRVPAGRLRDLADWQGSARLTSPRASAYGWSLTEAGATARVAKGLLTIRDVTGQLEGAAVSGSAEAHLAAPYRYEGQLSLAKGDLASLQRLAPDVRPPLAVAGQFGVTADVSGTLNPFTAKVVGSGTGENVKIEKVSVDRLHFNWATADGVLKLTDVKTELYGGDVTGGADVPLNDKQAGKVDLSIKGVDVGALAQAVPGVPLRLEGKVSGTVKGTLPAAPAGGQRSFDADVDVSAPKLMVQGLPTEKLTGSVTYRNGSGEYHLKGGLLGGTFDLDGRFPPRPAAGSAPPAKPEAPRQKDTVPVLQPGPPADSHLHVRGAQLGRLGEALGVRELTQLHGRVDLDVDFRLTLPDYTPVGTGTFSVGRLRWGDQEIAETVRGDIVLAEGEARVRNLSGTLGGGTLRGQLALRLRDLNRSYFNISVDDADAARVLAPWPSLAANVTGSVDARLRGTMGRHWSGGGTVVLARGRVFGVEVSDWRLPLRFDLVPARGRAQVDLDDISAQLGRGRVSGHATLGFGLGTHLDGSLRFYGVDLRTLLRSVSQSTSLGGQLSGRVDFAGHDVRSFDDVTATVDTSFSQTQALQIPVLSQIAPYILRGSSNATFQTGELKGRLANGVFRVQRLSLSGSTINLFAQGTVTTAERLNLDVTATTGVLGVSNGFLRLIGLRIPAVGPIPLSLLLQVTNYFSSSSVHLIVTGTIRTPSVQVEPLSLLTEEAARFFLLRSNVPLP